MSQDFTAVCDKHRVYHHLGQDAGGMASFGYGSKDEAGRLAAAEFVSEHLWCGLYVVRTDDIPAGYADAEARR